MSELDKLKKALDLLQEEVERMSSLLGEVRDGITGSGVSGHGPPPARGGRTEPGDAARTIGPVSFVGTVRSDDPKIHD